MPSELYELNFDAVIYNLECLQATIYKFQNQISAEINIRDNNYYCRFHPNKNDFEWMEFKHLFLQSLNDQELRRKIADRTENYRNLILGLAFSKSGLQNHE